MLMPLPGMEPKALRGGQRASLDIAAAIQLSLLSEQ